MKPLELQSALKRKEYAPLYFFYGDETFLINKTVEHLKEKLLDQQCTDAVTGHSMIELILGIRCFLGLDT